MDRILSPYTLQREQLCELLPQRGPIFACTALTVLDACRFHGVAHWPADHTILAGHFPGLPLVPGVLLIETATQLAGAGLRSTGQTDADAQHIGVLAAVRRCSLRRPVLPGQDVDFDLQCRLRGGPVQIRAQVKVAGQTVAQIETLMMWAARNQFYATDMTSRTDGTAVQED